MRKRVVRVAIFIALAIAAAIGGASVAGALNAPASTSQPDQGIGWE
jgi:hypothetical protein